MSSMEETFYRDVALGFAPLENGQTVTVESKEVFFALLRKPAEQPLSPPSQNTKKGR